MLEWTASTGWWLVAGALVAAELLTGTFYLLMLALGAAVAALAAHAGVATATQMAVASIAGGGAVAAWHLLRARRMGAAGGGTSGEQSLDVGCPVQVNAWQDDGTTRVHHRGSTWDARLATPGPALPGRHVIQGVQGNRLLLAPSHPGP